MDIRESPSRVFDRVLAFCVLHLLGQISLEAKRRQLVLVCCVVWNSHRSFEAPMIHDDSQTNSISMGLLRAEGFVTT